jgi:hypothetical protein
MNEQTQTTDLIPRSNYSSQIKQFEDGLLSFIEQHGLPTVTKSEKVVVKLNERFRVFGNIEGAIERIELEQRQRSIYIVELRYF